MVEVTVLLPVHGSAAVIKRFAERDDRFVYLRTIRNLGSAAKAVNYTAPNASGRWFVYSSHDKFHSKKWLSKLHARAQETGADAVLPDVVSHDWTIAGNALWPMAFPKDTRFCDFGTFADEYTVVDTWATLSRSAALQASLSSAFNQKRRGIRSLAYRIAARSYTWFCALARISAILSQAQSWSRLRSEATRRNRNLSPPLCVCAMHTWRGRHNLGYPVWRPSHRMTRRIAVPRSK